MRHKWLFLIAALVLGSTPARGAEYDAFVGDYEGRYAAPEEGEGRDRDLGVSISAVKNGFNTTWVTSTLRGEKAKDKRYSIDFVATDREHIYEAAQKKNVFGGREPLDPLKGEPYAWSRVKDRTLSTYVLTINDDGGYEIQTFHRTLNEDGNLDLRFSRVHNGEVMRAIEVTLTRKGGQRTESDR